MTAGPVSHGSRGLGATVWAPETVTADPYNAQTPSAALAEPLTPVGAFFVRDHFGIPPTTPGRWRLRIGGAAAAPFDIGHDELLAMEHRELDVVVECAGNGRSLMTPRPPGLPWSQQAVGCAHFAGVPFRSLADRARIDPAAVEIVFTGADSGAVRRPPHGLRAQPAARRGPAPRHPPRHPDERRAARPRTRGSRPPGGPGRYAVADVKWLVGARAVTQPFTGVFQAEEYRYVASRGTPEGPVTTVRVKSLITEPEPDEAVRRGHETLVRGRAWSGDGVPVRRVEVRAAYEEDDRDGERGWHEAVLDPPAGPYGWSGWSYRWTPQQPGPYRLLSRATDARGDRQPAQAPWNAHGYGCNPVACVEVVVV
ncbi:molybdopterin-dependent oxidoreductase [Streptomyces sp. MS1.HAVA.3]|uniref:Molybdopterin-dependent oxidoreductase n=1 Tax=Streptomyces caledonius TaxID=3134107 RepID=A0ABU8U172_9ACTN